MRRRRSGSGSRSRRSRRPRLLFRRTTGGATGKLRPTSVSAKTQTSTGAHAAAASCTRIASHAASRRRQRHTVTHPRAGRRLLAAIVEQLDLPSVPEFFPTAEQFKDPLAFVQTIYDQAALYGICIINPPAESWKCTVTPDDWEAACKTAQREATFDIKKQKLLNAQRKSGDPGFEFLDRQLNLGEYAKETEKYQERVRKTLPRPVDIDDEIDVETAFFDTMAREQGNQTVIYGNDVEGTLLENDSGVKDNPWAPMRISLHADSPIRALGDDCPGITRPYMYFGMFFTFFCWHTEDNDLYSINYMIGGKPKTWYAVPDHAAEGFEQVRFHTKNHGFHTKNHRFHTKNDELDRSSRR